MQLIYEKSVPGRRAVRAPRLTVPAREPINKKLLRARPAALPEMPELEIVRHFTNLSRRNFSIDTNFYPLGSCTMKYNPKACETAAAHPGFTQIHPLWPQLRGGGQLTQGALCLLYETERMLSEITGMSEFTLQPLAGSHGELTGAMIIAAWHRDQGHPRKKILIPDSAHGTNPASAALAGFDVVSIPSTPAGTVDVERLKAVIDGDTAGMMMTNPNTLGLFEPEIEHIAELIHAAGGLIYYDGANLNAILGRCKPADMGFDVCHLNLHKTFATPHGGGGPGAGPVGVTARLRPFLPISRVIKKDDGTYALDYEHPKSIGYIAPFYGNFGVLVRTYAYCLMVGGEGLRDISNHAVLNANYLLAKLREFFPANYAGNCMHEFVLSARPAGPNGVRALDLAKGLIDRGIHPPTVYFPLIVPEAMMIEPTETETRETLDRFVEVMRELAAIARDNPAELKNAPVTTPVGRLDEVAAARNMNLACLPPDE
ncbi:MAG: aminomethyl-transferring glycine dehydrogenase subunit GcvPB [Kiritimatiellia bacterium]